MLGHPEREAIERLWKRKLDQDEKQLPQSLRHRNLEPDSAEFICALAAGCHATRLAEIGGSSGISTIALASAARRTKGVLVSMEIEPARQTEARETIASLGLADRVEFVLGDAGVAIPGYADLDFVLIDCEKEDYIRFFDLLRLAPEALVVADNIISHNLSDYVAHVRRRPGAESVTLPVGKGLELTRLRRAAG
jgi:predicted O-methyltransferase YrrM